jgi:hypothetical protein
MMLQVIDAMGDNQDCQREHQSRKLASNPAQEIEQLCKRVICSFPDQRDGNSPARISNYKLPNYKFPKELHAEE